MSNEHSSGSGNMPVHIPASWRSHAHNVSSRLKQYANNSEHIRSLLDRGRELRHGDSNAGIEARYLDSNAAEVNHAQSQRSAHGESSLAAQRPQRRQKQTWVQWAGEKYRITSSTLRSGSGNSGNGDSSSPTGQDHIWLFPGWATRRYKNRSGEEVFDNHQFSIEIFVSGYASRVRPPELATRSQRAFMRLARAFANLPKLPPPSSNNSTNAASRYTPSTQSSQSSEPSQPSQSSSRPPLASSPSQTLSSFNLTPSTEDLIAQAGGLKLPPLPNEIDDVGDSSEEGSDEREMRKEAEDEVDKENEREEVRMMDEQFEQAEREVEREEEKEIARNEVGVEDIETKSDVEPQTETPAFIPESPQPYLDGDLDTNTDGYFTKTRAGSSSTSHSAATSRSSLLSSAGTKESEAGSTNTAPTSDSSHQGHDHQHSRHNQDQRKSSPSNATLTLSTANATNTTAADTVDLALQTLRTLHANLDARLRPFWASALTGRVVRVKVYVGRPPSSMAEDVQKSSAFENGLVGVVRDVARGLGFEDASMSGEEAKRGKEVDSDEMNFDFDLDGETAPEPLFTQDLVTSASGAFQARLEVPWERVSQHALARRFLRRNGGKEEEDRESMLYVVAELVKDVNGNASASGVSQSQSHQVTPSASSLSLSTPPATSTPTPATVSAPGTRSVSPSSSYSNNLNNSSHSNNSNHRFPAPPQHPSSRNVNVLPSSSSLSVHSASTPTPTPRTPTQLTQLTHLHPSSTPSSPTFSLPPTPRPSPAARTLLPLFLPPHPPLIRLVSDIDDTIKHSSIPSGARVAFRNAFVRPLEEVVVPGMADWYKAMRERGVGGFHYVSNAPFELLPVINEFIRIANLPLGSIKLKSYTGRSLFNGLLSAPAVRKRSGLIEVLDCFPEAKFILVGDSGEQDLELYASVAAERPGQVLAVFVRDCSTVRASGSGSRNGNDDEDEIEPIEDPIGDKALQKLEKARMERSGRRFGSVLAGNGSGYFSALPRSPVSSYSPNTNTIGNGVLSSSPPSSPSSMSLPGSQVDVSNVSTPTQENTFFGNNGESVPSISVSQSQPNNIDLSPPEPAHLGRITPNSRSSTLNIPSLVRKMSAPYSYVSSMSMPRVRTPIRSPSEPVPRPKMSGAGGERDGYASSPNSPPSPSSSKPTSPSSSQLNLSSSNSNLSSSPPISIPGQLAPSEAQSLPPPARKRYELQMRVYKARLVMPGHVTLRVFRRPEECVEVWGILDGVVGAKERVGEADK